MDEYNSILFELKEKILKWIMVLVHCRNLSILVGATDHFHDSDDEHRKIIPFQQRHVHIHPKYESASYYDVAVVDLEEPLTFNEAVQPVCLPETPDTDVDVNANKMATLLGSFANVSQEFLSTLSRPSQNPQVFTLFDRNCFANI